MCLTDSFLLPQSPDFRLNPVLRKACRADIPKFCQSILNKASEDSELEGQVIACLKLKYADQVSPQKDALYSLILERKNSNLMELFPNLLDIFHILIW